MTENQTKLDGFRNEWTFGGNLSYLKRLFGEFGASLKIKGVSQRNNFSSAQICELTCLMTEDVYGQLEAKNVELFDDVILSGHIESWQKMRGGIMEKRQMFIADYLLGVTKKKRA